MSEKLLECPVCKARHKLDVPEGKLIYKCPSCKLTVRCMPVQEIEIPKAKEEPVEIISVQEIPDKVAEAVNKAISEVLEVKESEKSKPQTRKKGKSKQGSNK